MARTLPIFAVPGRFRGIPLKILALYFLVLAFICLRDLFRVRTFDDYVAAGRRQGTFTVTASLLATIIGASATVGVAARAEQIGGAAFWWLGAGAIGLFLQAAFFSVKVRNLSARTLPELAEKTVGSAGRRLVALIIVVSWVGVIAAQFMAVAGFVGLILDAGSGTAAIVGTALAVILYTLAGGQLSVARTDVLQIAILFASLLGTFLWLALGFQGEGFTSIPAEKLRLFNEKFGGLDFAVLFFPVAGAYILGPDIISRNLMAKDGQTAKRSAIYAGGLLLCFSALITLIGIWSGIFASGPGNPLFRLASGTLPFALAALLSIGLISSLISSADTCLINAAAIFGNDILRTTSVKTVRILVAAIGLVSLLLALRGQDIIGLLLGAYSVYTPGIVLPLAVAILAHKRRRISRPCWFLAVVLGGLCGLLPTIFPSLPGTLPILGMGLSLLCSICSLRRPEAPVKP